MDTSTKVLTTRQTALRMLLDRISDENSKGRKPTKTNVVGLVPSKTRANHYAAITKLIKLGLAVNEGTSSAYALALTDLGKQEVAV